MSKIMLEIELNPFVVPESVLVKSKPGLRQEGIKQSVRYSLSELDEKTLDQLCVEFRASIFSKAGKADLGSRI